MVLKYERILLLVVQVIERLGDFVLDCANTNVTE